MSAGIESGFPFNAFYNAVSLIKLFKKKKEEGKQQGRGREGGKKRRHTRALILISLGSLCEVNSSLLEQEPEQDASTTCFQVYLIYHQPFQPWSLNVHLNK